MMTTKLNNVYASLNYAQKALGEYETILLACDSHLRNYLRMLERDDYDPHAVDKMKGVNAVLKDIKEVL